MVFNKLFVSGLLLHLHVVLNALVMRPDFPLDHDQQAYDVFVYIVEMF